MEDVAAKAALAPSTCGFFFFTLKDSQESRVFRGPSSAPRDVEVDRTTFLTVLYFYFNLYFIF